MKTTQKFLLGPVAIGLVSLALIGHPSAPGATADGMALIPAGSFTMGDTLDGESDATPTNVYVSAFYMDTNLVSYSQWQTVYNWATNAGYGFDNAGSGKAGTHPVQTVNWYDAAKWCNARSQQGGLTPVYYTDAGLTQVFTNGDVSAFGDEPPYVNWGANGYRLPTEAEWEKGARGGLSGQRFPWGDTISESQANYWGQTGDFSFDSGPDGFNAAFDTGGEPYTSPVGTFAANGYGLYDMAGNVFEWCWDGYWIPYAGGIDPHPGFGSDHVTRGGDWDDYADVARCADRRSAPGLTAYDELGFRCVSGVNAPCLNVHWVNDAGQDAYTVVSTNGVFTTDFKGTNDLKVTPLTSDSATGLNIDVFGGASPGNNPMYVTGFAGVSSNGTGDGVAGDIEDLNMTSTAAGALQFDFSSPLGAQDRILVVDTDGYEQYLLQAYAFNGWSYVQEANLAGWIVQDYSGMMGATPDSRWPVWNPANGTITSGAGGAGLNEELFVLVPDQNINRLVITKQNTGAAGWNSGITFLSLHVIRATPVITWANPTPIFFGTALSSNQLDATASVPGSFAYTPTNGKVLNMGTNTVSVIFTPTDTVDYSSVTDSVSLVVVSNILPAIASQPCSTKNDTGGTQVFTVTASGATPFTYQWMENGANLSDGGNISGSATANLTLSNLGMADAGSYSVVVTNASGSATSVVATLTVVGNRILSPPQVSTNGRSFGFSFATISGQSYTILQTTNAPPTRWLVYSNFTGDGTLFQFSMPYSSSIPYQFFQVSQGISNINTRTADGMALIPAGSFTMGNFVGDSDITDAATTTVTVSAFYMDINLVRLSQWQSVYNWAIANGYGFDHAGLGKAANHPVQTVEWYDVVKWCNARSQQAGLRPVYYTDAGLTQVCTNGDTDAVYPNWTANGYRLPTEAEWEKAARGGLSGQRFPWGDTISESQANYWGCTYCGTYDLGPAGYNAAFETGGEPYTSPAGYFSPNGYGLYDMAGNVCEWCWDWYGTPYAGGTDPCGPASSPIGERVIRGGNWAYGANSVRCAYRDGFTPDYYDNWLGFRCVRGH